MTVCSWLLAAAAYSGFILAVARFLSNKWHPDAGDDTGGLVLVSTDGETIDPTAPQHPLDEQSAAILIELCEEAMLEEPYTNRAVFLSRMADDLRDWLLER